MKEVLVGAGLLLGTALAGFVLILLGAFLGMSTEHLLKPYVRFRTVTGWILKSVLFIGLAFLFIGVCYTIGSDLLKP